ncbi:MAG TPA: hypothetical protein DCM10_01870 [Xanthomarina gelatinilytica]|nr:hypothetical protein [Xanthomarina gelatinilytica]|tara:strand:+ start:2956 stop:4080 length:1125 start_codon:yes stop_codon:yes gene_type:complete
MNTKDFKSLLRESILSSNCGVLQEDEEIGIDLGDEASPPGLDDEAPLLPSYVKNFTQELSQAIDLIDVISARGDVKADNFAKMLAYYYMAAYYDDDSKWEASLKNSSSFGKNITILLQQSPQFNKNIKCYYKEILDWVNKNPMFQDGDTFSRFLVTKADEADFKKFTTTLRNIRAGKYRMPPGAQKLLSQRLQKVKNFDMSLCSPSKAPSQDSSQKQGIEEPSNLTTPQEKQTLKAFMKELNKIPQFQDLSDIIVDALVKDLGTLADNTMRGVVDEQGETKKKRILRDVYHVRNILEAIKSNKTKYIAQIALIFIKRFLSRNNIVLSKPAKRQLDILQLNPTSKKDLLRILRNVRGKNLEEQRYEKLLKRFKIK